MAKTRAESADDSDHYREVVVSMRCTQEFADRLENYRRHLKRSLPGGNWSRSGAAMHLLARKLEEEGF